MTDLGTDPISPLAHELIAAGAYEAPVVRGAAPARAVELLSGVRPEQLLAVPATSYPHAAGMLAGLWLWHDALDECHQIVQAEPAELRASVPLPHQATSKRSLTVRSAGGAEATPDQVRDATGTFAFWHAIMHRREGDFSNAKYWYRRAGAHPMLPVIAANLGLLLNNLPADKSLLRLTRGGWDPDAFVDLAEALDRKPADERMPAFVALQRLEWRTLFDHCARVAVGS